ncbi:hypothetical protein NicSoilB8_17810 [Arthrobacter sp. NicSoilB8]|nr:hypothetical protein NicSoilB8_17810 [Arthrobacter sp. NicSoilB8]
MDVDDTIIDVHDYSKVGSGYAYSGVRRLNALLAAVSTKDTTPVVLAQRLRKGAANSARGAKRRITDALSTLKRLQTGGRVLCRFDSAFYGHDSVAVALAGGAYVSLTMHMDPAVKRAIAGIPETAWETIENTDTVFGGQNPPQPRHHRAGQCRPEGQRTGSYVIRCFSRELGLAPRRRALPQSTDRDDPPQTHPCPGPHRHQRPENTAPPPRSLALANTMAGPIRPPLPAAPTSLNPVNPATRRNQDQPRNTTGQQGPESAKPEGRKPAETAETAETEFRSSSQADRWIKLKLAS